MVCYTQLALFKLFIFLVAQYHKTLVDRKTTPRMPWHDVTLGVVGPIARDIARHFIQRWNFLKSNKSMHRRIVPFLLPKGEFVAARDESNFSGTCKVQLLRSSSRWSSDVEREVITCMGKLRSVCVILTFIVALNL